MKKMQHDLEPREWFIQGGGGYEGGEEELKSTHFTAEGLIGILEAYDRYLTKETIRIMTEASIDALKGKRK